jgi:pimeloyl-ACP methyl ester carboxylesterase
VTPAWERAGSGPPLLLLPGTFSDRRAWARVLGSLTPRFECLLFDPRGTGASPDPGRPFTPDELCDDALAVLDAAGVERAHLAGHSLGAVVALLLAARHPGRVRRVAALAPTLDVDARLAAVLDLWEALARSDVRDHLLHLGLVLDAFGRPAFEQVVPAVVADLDRHPPARETVLRYVACDRAQDLRPHLGRVDAATMVIAGEQDGLSGPGAARAVAAAIAGARLEVIAGTGHSMHIEAPRETARLLVEFLSA